VSTATWLIAQCRSARKLDVANRSQMDKKELARAIARKQD
jgi:hypothetical protein